jgi:hypothetical protein
MEGRDMTNGNQLPPDFTRGFPDPNQAGECEAFVRDIINKWESRTPKTQGKHWALQLYGNNPISGYRIKIKQCGPNDP